jgi:fructose 1,6-bisphosphatase
MTTWIDTWRAATAAIGQHSIHALLLTMARVDPAGLIMAGVACAGFQLADGRLIGPRDMFDDPSYDESRRDANRIADFLRMHGPFEPHRLPLDEMEYTSLPQVMDKVKGRWEPL